MLPDPGDKAGASLHPRRLPGRPRAESCGGWSEEADSRRLGLVSRSLGSVSAPRPRHPARGPLLRLPAPLPALGLQVPWAGAGPRTPPLPLLQAERGGPGAGAAGFGPRLHRVLCCVPLGKLLASLGLLGGESAAQRSWGDLRAAGGPAGPAVLTSLTQSRDLNPAHTPESGTLC